ncbi:MAG: SH3 domain-containing protein [Sedimentisphaerales bacterium]|nr:SH3 domain-containing protein [Sedimentisphaerales bacterium]
MNTLPKNFRFSIIIAVLTGCGFFICHGLAQVGPALAEPQAPVRSAEPMTEADKIQETEAAFQPYIGTITGDDVNIRSGPAEIYYPVGKLQKGQKVVVYGERQGKANWAKIAPTAECFSYISMDYVRIRDMEPAVSNEVPAAEASVADAAATDIPVTDVNETATTEQMSISELTEGQLNDMLGEKPIYGIVTGDRVRVRAGSLKVPPANANQVQSKVDHGTVVRIIGRRDNFYKIVPPPDCYFWISLDYVKRVGPASEEAVQMLRKETDQKIADSGGAPYPMTGAQLERKEYQDITQMFSTEQNKPLKQRDYTVIKRRLAKLIETVASPSVQAAAVTLRQRIDQAEIALQALKTSLAQDEKLRITLEKIDEEINTLAATNDPPQKTEKEIVVKGRLAASAVFTTPNRNRRFLVLDDKDTIIYYAIAGKEGLQLDNWLNKNVSLVGNAQYDSFGRVRLLHVTSIIELPPGK